VRLRLAEEALLDEHRCAGKQLRVSLRALHPIREVPPQHEENRQTDKVGRLHDEPPLIRRKGAACLGRAGTSALSALTWNLVLVAILTVRVIQTLQVGDLRGRRHLLLSARPPGAGGRAGAGGGGHGDVLLRRRRASYKSSRRRRKVE
jgi:hypothetical protein